MSDGDKLNGRWRFVEATVMEIVTNARVLLGQLPMVALCVGMAVQAQEEKKPSQYQSASFYFENDMFGSTDRLYTNGVKLTLLSKDVREMTKLPAWARAMRDRISLFRRSGHTSNFGVSIGQSIFTPEDIVETALIEEDVPYAGWLYGSVSLHHKSEIKLHVLELTLGIVGPEALGEDAQNTVHRLRDLQTAEGWANQLETEPGIILTYEQKRRWFDDFGGGAIGGDVIPSFSFSLGNVLTQATLGATFRVGHSVPTDFHGTRIRVSGAAMPPGGGILTDPDKSLSVYVFAGVEGRAVARNIFLDGNTFTDSHSVDREVFVGEAELGAALCWRGWRLTYAQVFRTEEFERQDKGHSFGSLNVTYSF